MYYAKKKTDGFPEIREWARNHNLKDLSQNPIITASLKLHRDIRIHLDDTKYQSYYDQVLRSSLSIATNFSEHCAKSYSLPFRIALGEAYETYTSLRVCPHPDEELCKRFLSDIKHIIGLLMAYLDVMCDGPMYDEKE